jgi:glycosyltransferase involved in cell wall biosynthesis
MAHETYRLPGGEDESFREELAILRRHGHEVVTYTRSNEEIDTRGIISKARLLASTVWAEDSYEAVTRLIQAERPGIAHFQNIFPLISPSVYYACRRQGVPVVQSLRNYRLVCANALFLRNGRTCEDCLGKFIPWPGVVHACYRRSRTETAAVAAMLTYHRFIRTWQNQVDLYIALTEFGRQKFIAAGLPPDKIFVKPNPVADPGIGSTKGDYVLFVGQLSEEKGIRLLLDAWRQLSDIPLRIMGAGPLESYARDRISSDRLSAVLVGRQPHDEVMQAAKECAFVVFPSLCYESFGRGIVEAFASGKPVVGTRHGAIQELIEHGVTGLNFGWNDPEDLAAQVRWLWSRPAELRGMGEAARKVYLERYTPEHNYRMMAEIYNRALVG